MSTNLGVWFDVPNGSTMSFWVSSEGMVGATAEFNPDSNDQPDERWPGDSLLPGPRTALVKKNASYGVRISVTFHGDETERATIHARVVDPSGAPLGTRYDYEVAGKRGDAPQQAHLTIINAGTSS